MSTLQQRRESRDLTENLLRSKLEAGRVRLGARWVNFVTPNAVPMVATLAMVWLATVCLVVVNSFLPLDLVPLVYMLPVVVAATQWGIVPGLVAAFAGAAVGDVGGDFELAVMGYGSGAHAQI